MAQGGMELARDRAEGASAGRGEIPRKFSNHAIHLVRTAQVQTLSLSSMADNKASILIGATFVVFSMSITNLFGVHHPFHECGERASASLEQQVFVSEDKPGKKHAPNKCAIGIVEIFVFLGGQHLTALVNVG